MAPTTKKAAPQKKSATGSHPTFLAMIQEAIKAHPEEARNGISRPQLKKYLANHYKIDMSSASNSTNLANAIRRGSEKGDLTLPKGTSGRVKLPSSKASRPALAGAPQLTATQKASAPGKENAPPKPAVKKTTAAKPKTVAKPAVKKAAPAAKKTAAKPAAKKAPASKKPAAKKTSAPKKAPAVKAKAAPKKAAPKKAAAPKKTKA